MPSRWTVCSTRAVSSPTFVTVPATGFATQTASGATATSEMPRSSWTAPRVGLDPPPIRQRVPPDAATQAAFSPTAIEPPSKSGTLARATGRAVRSSRRTTAPSFPRTQTPAGPAATAAAPTAVERAVIAPVAAAMRTTE